MRLRYFIDYRYDDNAGCFLPIGIWIHNPVEGAVDIYYPDQESDEYWDAMWVINRLVEGGLKTPDDFLEFHQQYAGYRGMRGPVKETTIELNFDRFGRQVLQEAIERAANAAE